MASTSRKRSATREWTDAELDAQIAAGRKRHAQAFADGQHATAARYDAATERVVLELSNGTAFAFPARIVRGLEHATAAERARLEVSPLGDGIHWEALDADISVPGILASMVGRTLAASTLGRVGGQARSTAKAKAAKANGAKGGRPRKEPALSAASRKNGAKGGRPRKQLATK